EFFTHRWHKGYFYGSGCADEDKIHTVKSSLVAQFHTAVDVESNLLGVARSMLGQEPGIVCILSIGSNSCMYDGHAITHNVRPGGYILGDEGSNAFLGKRLVADIIKEVAPKEVADRFFSQFETSANAIFDRVYSHPRANLLLSSYSDFLQENLDLDYCRTLVYESFMAFFKRNVANYDYKSYPVSFTGRTCIAYSDILHQAAADFGIRIHKIRASALPGLIEYHSLSEN
ncbi:MAG: hypothetical protein K2N16_05735, partial [Muribaculaceae bacterium]|nr:hypothetical protein [Muribaculaceae bacterium]